jgi:hypothetical protein
MCRGRRDQPRLCARVFTNDPRADLRRCLRPGSIGGQCSSWESRRVEATVTARDVTPFRD